MKKNKDILPIFSKKELADEFQLLKKSRYRNVSGIWFFAAKQAGPNLGITINTHGNEPSGLAVSRYLRKYFDLEKNLKKGSITIVVNNLKATEKYFKAKTLDAKKKTRFCDINFNRLPTNTMKLKNSKDYEIKRAQELKTIWDGFDIGFDIHSTTLPSKPMIIACNGFEPRLVKGFPITVLITNIENIQSGKPAASFYGQGKIPTVEIEAGSHEDPKAFQVAIKCALILMANLEMIEKKSTAIKRSYEEYYICDSIIFPDFDFELTKTFKMFEKISKGQILAKSKNNSIVAKYNGHAIFASSKKAVSLKEEMMFISKRKTKRYI